MAYVLVAVLPSMPIVGGHQVWMTVCYPRAKEFRQALDAQRHATDVIRRWSEGLVAPTSPEAGEVFFDVKERRLFRWSGAAWNEVQGN